MLCKRVTALTEQLNAATSLVGDGTVNGSTAVFSAEEEKLLLTGSTYDSKESLFAHRKALYDESRSRLASTSTHVEAESTEAPSSSVRVPVPPHKRNNRFVF